jgi:hypothetical protein
MTINSRFIIYQYFHVSVRVFGCDLTIYGKLKYKIQIPYFIILINYILMFK